MGFFDLFRLRRPSAPSTIVSRDETAVPGQPVPGGSERGFRSTPENALLHLYRGMWVDPDRRQAILDIRHADRIDGRVKQIHRKTARAAAKGGLILRVKDGPKRLQREWQAFEERCALYRIEKLQSDLRGLMMEGNLPMQWVLDGAGHVAGAVRMPADTINPKVGPNGRFLDPRAAYEQLDVNAVAGGSPVLATFALWQLTVGRIDPDNYDDWGAMGRPYLDASRGIWKKLLMTEESLVVRRHMRAPLRMSHVIEGASPEELQLYKAEVEATQAHGAYHDYYSNKKGAVTPVQGDANLEHIADVNYLLDTFFTGAPAPKGLFGLGVGDLNRDILEDLKKDYFDEIDALQDVTSAVYEQGFRLHLLMAGVNPAAYDFEVQFRERRVDTPNQRADLALKMQALGMSRETVWETTGIDTAAEQSRVERQMRERDPYPMPGMEGPPTPGMPGMPPPAARPRVSITPGNAPKGESATTIATRSAE
jgi:hypothetical protein